MVLWVWTARPSRESAGVGEGLGDQVPGWPQTVGSREEPLARQGELEAGKQQKRTKDPRAASGFILCTGPSTLWTAARPQASFLTILYASK
ncbi:hypothetical protein Celaphus_00001558, partial [Cervus elaphus hippelaphus]